MNLQENIRRVLREETSTKDKTRGMVSKYGFKMVKNMFGDDNKFYDTIDLNGSQDDMLFIAKAIMEHDVKARLCGYIIEKTKHSIKISFEIPKYFPEEDEEYWPNRRQVNVMVEEISNLIYNLGKDKVRGHRIHGSIGDC